jgi:hypothetical protein
MLEKKPKGKQEKEQRRGELFEREIGREVIKEFQEAPNELWSYYPHIADKIERQVSPKKPSPGKESIFYFYLTEPEREFRLNSLRSIMERFQRDGQVSREEAIKALEDAAALRDYAEDFKDSLLAIIQRPLELSLDAGDKQTVSILRGKSEHHSYTLIRGITLSLTWDRKLIKIETDPKELAERRKMLSFVGCGSDRQPDVARNHDAYLGSSFNE